VNPVQADDEWQEDFGEVKSTNEIKAVVKTIDFKAGSQRIEKEHETNGKAKKLKANATLLKASDILIRAICWLWDQWLPAGKLTILGGAGGTGKTSVALSLAAAITSSGRFPDGSSYSGFGNVLIWSSEDDPDDVLVPRLMAMGANLSRIYFIHATSEAGEKRAFDPATDIGLLAKRVQEIGGITLLIIDPIVSAVANDMNQANVVRRSLQPIVDFSKEQQCATLGISHLGKGTQGKEPTERILGSQAFTGFARMVWLTATNKDTGDRVLVRSKSNISALEGGFNYAIEQIEIGKGISASKVIWKEAVEGYASEIMQLYETSNEDLKETKTEKAVQFLRNALSVGNTSEKEIEKEYKEAGFSEATIRRAKKKIGVKSLKSGMEEGWIWSLPIDTGITEDAQKIPKMLIQKSEHLHENVNPFGVDQPDSKYLDGEAF